MKLRPELLRRSCEDGGIDLLDLLFDRIVHLDAEQTRALDEGDHAALVPLMIFEGPAAEALRASAWSGRQRPRPHPSAPPEDFEWSLELPEIIAPPWRDPDRLRRLAEDRSAGRRYLMLPGFLEAEAASRLAEQASALPYTRLSTEIVEADRHLLEAGELPEWQSLMTSRPVRMILGAILGIELPEKTFVNVWRLGRGDLMSVHPDGRLYRGTLSLGLNLGWRAQDGGAIAFGEPGPEGFVVRERWLPHAGDALLFAPGVDTWHAVEPVLSNKIRLSLTGWWSL
jgi:hypothetical protein